MADVAAHFLEEVSGQFRGHKRIAEGAMIQVSDENLFRALDEELNSIAILIKHLVGNMRSRFIDFLTTDGEKPDRHRDQEFELNDQMSRDDLMKTWDQGWKIVFDTIGSLGPDDLMKVVTVRGDPHTVLQAINRQLAHYAYHVGQIVMLSRYLRSAEWSSLSIPKGMSEQYKQRKAWGVESK